MQKTYNLNWNIEKDYDNSGLFCMQREDAQNFSSGTGTYLYVTDLRILNTGTPTYEYSYDGTTWSDLPSPSGYGTQNSLVFELNGSYNKLYLRAKSINPFHPWIFGLNRNYVISGNLTYLVNKNGETLPAQDNNDYRDGYLAEAFYNVSADSGKLISAKRCFYKTNKSYIPCGFFWALFKNQSNLKDCFKIQTDIDEYGCRDMFYGCRSLEMFPTATLNCINEGNGCAWMFYNYWDGTFPQKPPVSTVKNSIYHNKLTITSTASTIIDLFQGYNKPGIYYTPLKIRK